VPLAGYENEDGVIWHGFLNKDKPEEFAQLQRLYERCTLTVLPSLYEPFGLSPLEGMASGLPSIVSSRWALPESVPAGVVGENVEPGNVEELAEKMTYLFQHPDKLQEYGERCRPWIAEKYRWEKVVDRLEEFLKQIR
jgi:glycosyltransferase involved in cell wall biosynthesis